jgi:hypothetical protein
MDIIRVEYDGTITVEGKGLDGASQEVVGNIQEYVGNRIREGQIELIDKLTARTMGRRR